MNPARRGIELRRTEGGQLTIFVAIFTFACLVIGALVVDGGFLLAARRRAILTADAAARAGADRFSVDVYRSTGELVLDTAAASVAARQFLDAGGHAGSIDVYGDRVVVVVRFRHQTALLGIVGVRSVDVSGRGEARGVRGVVAAE